MGDVSSVRPLVQAALQFGSPPNRTLPRRIVRRAPSGAAGQLGGDLNSKAALDQGVDGRNISHGVLGGGRSEIPTCGLREKAMLRL